MRFSASLLLAVVGAVSPAQTWNATQQFVERSGELEFTGTMIARPLPGKDASLAIGLVSDQILRTVKETSELILEVPAGSDETSYAAALLATGRFQYVVPNWMCYPLRTPDDPLFGQQWHHAQIRSELAWGITTGSSNFIVAMTDTGVDQTHPDLASSLVPGFNSASDLAQANGGDVSDIHGHGTHVAGCMAAIGNNGTGVSGVGWGFKIMPIRVTNSTGGGATYEDLMQGARWAAENGARVISASYSGIDYEPLETTGAYIRSLGSLYLYAAGNDSRNLSWFDWPNVIVVGASTYGDARASFSAYGKAVDVFSPGVGILSSVVGGGYAAWSGTSMATPVANGLCALIWSCNPLLTPAQVENLLERNCTDLGPVGNDDAWGWGRIDAFRAVKYASLRR